jgi:hypothetical protein
VYTVDPEERRMRAAECKLNDAVLQRFAPSVMRGFRTLDSAENPFYVKFAEIAFPPSIGIYTHPTLRASGDATAHVVLTQLPVNGIVSEAGATPLDLATGTFGVMPLFSINTEEACLMDTALREDTANVIKPSGDIHMLDKLQLLNLSMSLDTLQKLGNAKTSAAQSVDGGDPTYDHHEVHGSSWIVSYAALANNPQGVRVFADEVTNAGATNVSVDIYKVRGMATGRRDGDNTTPPEKGAFVAVHVTLPKNSLSSVKS